MFLIIVRFSQSIDMFWRPMNHKIKLVFLDRRKTTSHVLDIIRGESNMHLATSGEGKVSESFGSVVEMVV